MSKQKRLSNIEYLRVISCLLVIALHVWAAIRNEISPANQWVHNVVNSVCNIGVSCFILISGYFGVRWKREKVVQLFMAVTGYSVIAYAINVALSLKDFSMVSAIKAVFPIFFNQNWYICCYLALLLLSPFINEYLEHLTVRKHAYLCGILLVIFSIVPTVFYYELPGTDAKGIWHFIMLYAIGRLIRREERFSQIKVWKSGILFALSVSITVFLNGMLLFFTGEVKNYYGRDCSFFIILSAISLFLVFLNMKSDGEWIGKISRYSLDIYLVHDAIMIKILNRYIFHFENYYNRASLSLITLLEIFVCFVISLIFAWAFSPLWKWIGTKVNGFLSLILAKVKKEGTSAKEEA